MLCPQPSDTEERAELETTQCYDMALLPLPLRLIALSRVFPSHKQTTTPRAAYLNPLALEMDIYSLAHHLCTM